MLLKPRQSIKPSDNPEEIILGFFYFVSIATLSKNKGKIIYRQEMVCNQSAFSEWQESMHTKMRIGEPDENNGNK